MKKFLSKKPVMITFIVLAVVFIAVYIGMLVRPVSYGFNYVYKQKESGVESILKMNFKSDKVMRQTMIEKEEGKEDEKTVIDMWIYRDGNKIYSLGTKEYVSSTELTDEELKDMNNNDVLIVSKAEYEVAIEDIKEAKEKGSTEYAAVLALKAPGGAVECGIYECKIEDEVIKNTQAVVFTIVHGIVTVALTSFAVVSVIFFATKKNKKKK